MLIDDRNHDDIIDKGAKDSAPDLGQEHRSVWDLDCFVSSWRTVQTMLRRTVRSKLQITG